MESSKTEGNQKTNRIQFIVIIVVIVISHVRLRLQFTCLVHTQPNLEMSKCFGEHEYNQ